MKGMIYCHFITNSSSDRNNLHDKTSNKSCSLVYGVMQNNFDNCTNSLRNRRTSIANFTISNQNSVIIHFPKVSTEDLVYCFIARGTVMMTTTAIEGTFKLGNKVLNIIEIHECYRVCSYVIIVIILNNAGRKTSSSIDVQMIIIPTTSCVMVILTVIILIVSGVIVIKRRNRYRPTSSTQ